jgi:hypothetical protein
MKAIKIIMPLLVFVFLSVTAAAQLNIQTTGDIPAKKLFLDVHHLGHGNVTAGAVAAAHQKDLKVQTKYGVQFIRYWVDTAQGDVYCLSSTADSSSITKTHAEAHGLIPDEVMAVTEGMEAAMLGGKNLYFDIHELGAGNVTTEAVASAHTKDLAVQKKYGVNFINYWVDEKNGKVFCLSEANDSSDVIRTHKEAHGLLPNYLLTVKQGQ